jgi:hypothetical protein
MREKPVADCHRNRSGEDGEGRGAPLIGEMVAACGTGNEGCLQDRDDVDVNGNNDGNCEQSLMKGLTDGAVPVIERRCV